MSTGTLLWAVAPRCTASQRFLFALHRSAFATEGWRSRALRRRIKSMSCRNSIRAKLEAQNANAAEGRRLNEEGYVAECSGDYICIGRSGEIITSYISSCILGGVPRTVVFELARGHQI